MRTLRIVGIVVALLAPVAALAGPKISAWGSGASCPDCPFCPSGLHR
jgi:hypothetical protein